MRVRVRAAAWAAVVLACLVTGPAQAATAAESGEEAATTWALAPADAEGPDGRVSLRHTIDAGGEVSDAVAVTNYGDRAATFAVYASDGTVTDGNFDVLASDEAPVAGGAWITVDPVEGSTPRDGGGIVLEVPPGTTLVVPVRIAVPANATPGDHPAGVVAELVRADGDGVRLTSRVGVRVHLRVAGEVVAALAPEVADVTYTPSWNPFAGGTVTVHLSVANAGNVRLGAETVATVSGPWGAAAAEAGTAAREVLPGEAADAVVEIPVAPLFVAWGDVVTTPQVVGEDAVDAAIEVGTASFTVWTVPWAQLALLAAVAGAFLLVRALQRRSARTVQARIDAAVAAATRDRAAGVPSQGGRSTGQP